MQLRKLISPFLLVAAGLALAACAALPAAPTAISPTAEPTVASSVAPTPVVATSGIPNTPITVQLILSKPPRLNEPAEVTLVVSAVADAPGTTAEIILPAAAKDVTGDLTWTGDIAGGGQHTMHATIVFQQEGNFTVEGKALRPAGNGDVWGDLAAIYLNVTAEAGQLGFSNEPSAPHSGGQAETPPAVAP